MEVRTIPALVVGLGGTGKRALTHLKRRIRDTYGRGDLPWIRLLSIDTDDAAVNNPPVISQLTGEYVNLANSECRIIDQSDTPQVISNLDAPENRHIKDWYPDPELKVDFPKASRGSGQVRMFGRIGLYKGENLHTIYRWLQQAAHDVSDPAAWDEYRGFNVDPNLQFIYIICSLCGGTGSGMFLDTAYMLRKLAGVDPSTRRFMGMFVLPEVYEPVVENQHIKRIYSNTYAALRELDFLMNNPRRSYTVRGKDHTFVDFQGDVPPFDFVFLFSNKNKRGAVISQRQLSGEKAVAADDRISQYMSETIMTDVLSPVTERSESILSNIFSSLAEPEQQGDRAFHKAFSSVGVASVKVPPVSHFLDMLVERSVNAVIDFLLRPDPEVTEKALAKEFFATYLSKVEEKFSSMQSLSKDSGYVRYGGREFFEEFIRNRPGCIDSIKNWSRTVWNSEVEPDNALDAECQAVSSYKESLANAEKAFVSMVKGYANDPQRGYAFICEWAQELVDLAKTKLSQVPAQPKREGDPRRASREALDSLQRIGADVQLPILRDTVELFLERLADYYDEHGRQERSRHLCLSFYNELIGVFESWHTRLQSLVAAVSDLDKQCDEACSSSVSTMSDVGRERVLVDKPLIGRLEVERFVNYLLSAIWLNGDWKATVPVLSDEYKKRITAELSHRLLEIYEAEGDDEKRRANLESEIRRFVKTRIVDELYPVDPKTGRVKEPTYVGEDGRSVLFDFAPENILQLMVAQSAPLWYVQTHQVGSATSPITFLGLNGAAVPEGVISELQKLIPTFRPTDLVLSGAEARVVIKQYDPLYSLASLSSIADYENYYKNTDRKSNPMHTDVRFARESEGLLQWLSYQAPAKAQAQFCNKGHDITRALKEDQQFCPECSEKGVKNLIAPGMMVCPECSQVIERGSRKCPECAVILGVKEEKRGAVAQAPGSKETCPGCQSLGKETPEAMVVPANKDAESKCFCPACGSVWGNLCPYCGAALQNPTLCTKGSDRCIFESPPIVLCSICSCPVTPDTIKCPRCYTEIEECAECRARSEVSRMVTKGAECPACNKARLEMAASPGSPQ